MLEKVGIFVRNVVKQVTSLTRNYERFKKKKEKQQDLFSFNFQTNLTVSFAF